MNKCFFDGGLFIIVVAATALAAAHENDKNRFNVRVCVFSVLVAAAAAHILEVKTLLLN